MNFKKFLSNDVEIPVSGMVQPFELENTILANDSETKEYSNNLIVKASENIRLGWYTSIVYFITRYTEFVSYVYIDQSVDVDIELLQAMFSSSTVLISNIPPSDGEEFLYVNGSHVKPQSNVLDTAVEQNNDRLVELVNELKPTYYMILYRPSYYVGYEEDVFYQDFLSGIKVFFPYGPARSTEILVIGSRSRDNSYPMEKYSKKDHEELLAYHNYMHRNTKMRLYTVHGKELSYDDAYLAKTLEYYQLFTIRTIYPADIFKMHAALLARFPETLRKLNPTKKPMDKQSSDTKKRR